MDKRKIFLVFFLFILIISSMYIGFKTFEKRSKKAYLEVKTDKSSYSTRETIRVRIYLVNQLNEEIVLPSKSYGLDISGPKDIVLTNVLLEAVEQPITVSSSTNYLIGEWRWNQEDIYRHQVDAGLYTIRVNLLNSTYIGEVIIEIT